MGAARAGGTSEVKGAEAGRGGTSCGGDEVVNALNPFVDDGGLEVPNGVKLNAGRLELCWKG